MMCLATGVVITIFLILLILARKEKPEQISSPMLKPIYKIALYLYKLACAGGVPIAGRNRVAKDLERLYPGENKELVCTDYYVKKLGMSLLVCLVGTFLALIVSVKSKEEQLLKEGDIIARGNYQEESQKLDLVAVFENGEENRFQVEVGTQRLATEEASVLAEELAAELPHLILGENQSLEEVTKDLLLEEAYEGYPFQVEWQSSRFDLVAETGMVSDIKDGREEVVLTARISYEGAAESVAGDREEAGRITWIRDIEICVVPPILTAEEAAHQDMEEMLLKNELESRWDTYWKLPDSYQGRKLTWKQEATDYSLVLWVGALVIAVLLFFLSDKDTHDSLEARKALMKRSYPDVLQKLVLYMGAGLTVRGAFQRIAGNYEQGRKRGKAEMPVYEEMLYTCRELLTGVSEGAAYEHFGRRTGLQEYIRMSTLLMQNLKKGNSTLLQRLREEADRAGTEQLQNSRRLGEEASTKLLLPMVMMLLVVMLMIMIPAFSSVGV